MANYCGTTRTNYFRVTNREALEELLKKTVTDDDPLELWTMDQDGDTLYGFGAHSSINGVYFEDDDESDCDYDAFTSELQKIVAPGDAIIIIEVGYEKLRYVGGTATIITTDKVECVDLRDAALNVARAVLRNPDFQTKTDY